MRFTHIVWKTAVLLLSPPELVKVKLDLDAELSKCVAR